MLLVDLVVPRDIDPKVESLDGVYLYGVDDLQSVIDENLAQRRQAAVEAEVMVNQLATELVTQQRSKVPAVPFRLIVSRVKRYVRKNCNWRWRELPKVKMRHRCYRNFLTV